MPPSSHFHCIETNDTVLLSALGRWEDGRVHVESLRELVLPPGIDTKDAVLAILRAPSTWIGCAVRPTSKRVALASERSELDTLIGPKEKGAIAGPMGESPSDASARIGLGIAATVDALEEELSPLRRGLVELNEIVPATFAAVSGVSRALSASDDPGERVLVWDAGGEESQLLLVESTGVTLCVPVPFGLDRIYELVRAELSLKLKGAAARLFFSDSFDFSDLGPRIAGGIAEALAPYLRKFDGKACSLLLLGLPTAQSWFCGMLAKDVSLRVFECNRLTLETALGMRLPETEIPGGPSAWLGILSYLGSVCRPDGAHFPSWEAPPAPKKFDTSVLFLPDDAPDVPSFFSAAALANSAQEASADEPAMASSRPPHVADEPEWSGRKATEGIWDAVSFRSQTNAQHPLDKTGEIAPSELIPEANDAAAHPQSSPFLDAAEAPPPQEAKQRTISDFRSHTASRHEKYFGDGEAPTRPPIPLPELLRESDRPSQPPPPGPESQPPMLPPSGAAIAPTVPPVGGGAGRTWAAIAAMNSSMRLESPEGAAANPLDEARDLVRPTAFLAPSGDAVRPPQPPPLAKVPVREVPETQHILEPTPGKNPWRLVATLSVGVVLLLVFVLVATLRSRPSAMSISAAEAAENEAVVTALKIEEGAGKVLFRPVPREAKVSWNGRVLMASPGQPIQLPAGKHELLLEHPGYENKVVPVVIHPDSLTSLGLVELARAAGSLNVQTNVPGVQIAVVPLTAPGGILGISSFSGEAPNVFNGVPAGRYRVTASVRGWQPQRFEVEVQAGAQSDLMIQWSAAALRIDTQPQGAEVHVNDRLIGRTPIERLEVPPGSVRIVMRLEGHRLQEERIEVTEGSMTPLSFKLAAVGRVFTVQELDRRPAPISLASPAPAPEGTDGKGRVVVSLVVEASGMTRSHQIVEATNPDAAQRVLEVAPTWRFRPGEIAGNPVECRIEVPIVVAR